MPSRNRIIFHADSHSRPLNMHSKTRCLAMVYALGLIWGGSFPCVELALTGFRPVTIAAARVTLGIDMQ